MYICIVFIVYCILYFAYVHVYICMYTAIWFSQQLMASYGIYVYICMYIYIHACTHTHTCICIHAHTHTYYRCTSSFTASLQCLPPSQSFSLNLPFGIICTGSQCCQTCTPCSHIWICMCICSVCHLGWHTKF